jgi:hypothetical protein
MKKETYSEHIRATLFRAIRAVAADLRPCVKNPGKDFSRTRKLPLQTMLLMLIGMGGGSLTKELHDWFGYDTDTATVSAFVQQRNKIRPEALEMVFRKFTDLVAPASAFMGYRLFAVDGSDLRLPSNPNDAFSAIRNQEDGKNYNLVHLDAMYDLTNKVYIDASIQSKKGMNEHSALVSMVDRSETQGRVITIMDRGYESFNNMAHFQEKSWNYIIRAKESYGIITRLSLPKDSEFDADITLILTRRQTKETLELIKKYPERYRWIQPHTTFDYIKPKNSTFYDLHFRVVRFLISDGIYETVYTNLDAEEFPPEKIKELYRLRWGIETSFRKLKYAVGLASLHSKKKDSILQEVFAKLILYNYSSMITHHVDTPKGKQINFSAALHFCRQFLRKKISSEQFLKSIVRQLSSIRPERKFRRFPNFISAIGFQYRIP